MKRIYHPYTKWECYKNGMWLAVTSDMVKSQLQNVINFISDHILFGKAMNRVITEWLNTCQNHLSDVSINRRSWLGQAACCIECGWCEGLVRMAWVLIDSNKQEAANKQADIYLSKWDKEKINKTIQLSLF